MINLLFETLADCVANALEAFCAIVLPIISFDFTTFDKVFPFAGEVFSTLQFISVRLVLIVAAVQIIPFFFSSKEKRSSPIRALFFSGIAVFAIYYGNYILQAILEIAQDPYNAILFGEMASDINPFEAVHFGVINTVLTDVFSAVSIPLYLIALCMVGFSFIKLILEVLERYVILFVLVYLSPLAYSTLASEVTSGICKRFFSMFLAQCVVLILNVWSLKMAISMFASLGNLSNPLLGLLFGYAFLRIASRLDSYLNQLGLNSAITGFGLGNEIISSGMMIASKLSGKNSGSSTGTGNAKSSSGGILGFSQKLAHGVNKYNPINGLGMAAKNAAGATAKTVADGFKAGKDSAMATDGTVADKINAGKKAMSDSMKQNHGINMKNASAKTQRDNIWARYASASGMQNTENIVSGMKSGGNDMSSSQLDDLAQNPHIAAAAFNSMGENTVNDSAAVSAVAQGTGLADIDSAFGTALSVGNGIENAENLQYALDGSGLSMSFDKDGKTEDWSIKNAQQFNALSGAEQIGYTPYKDSDGNQYYYRHTSSRTPTPQQRAEQSFNETMKNPSTTPLTKEGFSHMRKDSSNVAAYMSGLDNGIVQPEQASNIFSAINPGSMAAPFSAVANNLDKASCTKDGSTMSYDFTDPETGTPCSLKISPDKFSDTATAMKQSDGTFWYGEFSGPKNDTERTEQKFEDNLKNLVSNPNSFRMAPDQISYMNQPAHIENVNSMFDGFHASQSELVYNKSTIDNCRDMLHMMESQLIATGTPRNVIRDAQNALEDYDSGAVKEFKVNDKGFNMVFENETDGLEHQIVFASEYSNLPKEKSYRRNKGFTTKNINGKKYFGFHGKQDLSKDEITRSHSREHI